MRILPLSQLVFALGALSRERAILLLFPIPVMLCLCFFFLFVLFSLFFKKETEMW